MTEKSSDSSTDGGIPQPASPPTTGTEGGIPQPAGDPAE
jgi:hypothetical protein